MMNKAKDPTMTINLDTKSWTNNRNCAVADWVMLSVERDSQSDQRKKGSLGHILGDEKMLLVISDYYFVSQIAHEF